MAIDFDALSAELDDLEDGPSLESALAERARNDLFLKALQALADVKPPAAPSVTVSPEINVPEQPPAQVVVHQQTVKPVSWTFEFERNADGTIKRIHASPKE